MKHKSIIYLSMMYVCMILDPWSWCMYVWWIDACMYHMYVCMVYLWSLTLMHVCMMHMFVILVLNAGMYLWCGDFWLGKDALFSPSFFRSMLQLKSQCETWQVVLSINRPPYLPNLCFVRAWDDFLADPRTSFSSSSLSSCSHLIRFWWWPLAVCQSIVFRYASISRL